MKNWFLLAMFVLFGVTSSSAQTIEREWVDLALPSGTLWATQPEEGYYTFDEACAQFGVNLPTRTQWEELFKSCIVERVAGKPEYMKFTGRNGNTLFLYPKGVIRKGNEPHNLDAICFWTFSTEFFTTQQANAVACLSAGLVFLDKKTSRIPVILVSK